MNAGDLVRVHGCPIGYEDKWPLGLDRDALGVIVSVDGTHVSVQWPGGPIYFFRTIDIECLG